MIKDSFDTRVNVSSSAKFLYNTLKYVMVYK